MQPSWDPSGVLGVGAPYDWRTRPPAPQVVPIPNPAKGAQWSWQAPETHLLRLLAVYAVLAVGASPGTQDVTLNVSAPTGRVLVGAGLENALGAAGPYKITWAIGLSAVQIYTTWESPIPDIILPPGCSVRTSVNKSVPTDQWETITLLVQLI